MIAMYTLSGSEHWENIAFTVGNPSLLQSQTFQRGWPEDQGYMKISLEEGELKTLELLGRRNRRQGSHLKDPPCEAEIKLIPVGIEQQGQGHGWKLCRVQVQHHIKEEFFAKESLMKSKYGWQTITGRTAIGMELLEKGFKKGHGG